MSTPSGLTTEEARAGLKKYGPNRLPDPPRKNPLLQLLVQFTNPLVLTLLGAAVIATVVGFSNQGGEGILARFGDAIAILLIVILNALLGFYQERKAETALSALRRMEVPSARVRRDGLTVKLPSPELVPGDLIEVEAGDAVPADAELIESTELGVEESALTGESVAATRRTGVIFLGTTVTRGKALARVTATGASTELGKIGKMIAEAGNEGTPLENKLAAFGKRVLWACLGVSALLFGWGLVRGGRAWHQLLLEAVSFAVAAIPEGLPAITTITLALGMQRMAKRGAIIRKLPAVETLGAATVICTDKTGTLTQNEMTVRELFVGDALFRVSGEGYAPEGQFSGSDGSTVPVTTGPLADLLVSAALCNGAVLRRDEAGQSWRIVGDPTEGALLTVAAKAGFTQEKLKTEHRIIREIPFDSQRKRMTVIATDAAGHETAHVKGSADVILARCVRYMSGDGETDLSPQTRAALQTQADSMASGALRILAVARRVGPATSSDPEAELTFVGLVGMIDPPRREVHKAIQACHDAGIRAVMITGDHLLTAKAIATELGLWREGDEALTGPELLTLSDQELQARVGRVRVFARTTPEQKLRIVKAYKTAGEIVAMTGDGVNDAPALREAHIGIAMGRSGTDVARQAADMVITDDNFATIVEAVHEGRAIYRNIQKFIFFLLSSNAGLAVAVFGISLSRSWLPLTPLMILWINLVTNGFPALALGIDPPDPAQMSEPPRAKHNPLVTLRDYLGILYVGAVMGGFALCMYVSASCGATGARTMAFTLLALSPLAHAWSCRSPKASIVQQRPFFSIPLVVAIAISAGIHLLAVEIPALRPVFRTNALHRGDWLMIGLCALAVVPAVEIGKAVSRLRSRAHDRQAMLAAVNRNAPAASVR